MEYKITSKTTSDIIKYENEYNNMMFLNIKKHKLSKFYQGLIKSFTNNLFQILNIKKNQARLALFNTHNSGLDYILSSIKVTNILTVDFVDINSANVNKIKDEFFIDFNKNKKKVITIVEAFNIDIVVVPHFILDQVIDVKLIASVLKKEANNVRVIIDGSDSFYNIDIDFKVYNCDGLYINMRKWFVPSIAMDIFVSDLFPVEKLNQFDDISFEEVYLANKMMEEYYENKENINQLHQLQIENLKKDLTTKGIKYQAAARGGFFTVERLYKRKVLSLLVDDLNGYGIINVKKYHCIIDEKQALNDIYLVGNRLTNAYNFYRTTAIDASSYNIIFIDDYFKINLTALNNNDLIIIPIGYVNKEEQTWTDFNIKIDKLAKLITIAPYTSLPMHIQSFSNNKTICTVRALKNFIPSSYKEVVYLESKTECLAHAKTHRVSALVRGEHTKNSFQYSMPMAIYEIDNSDKKE